MVKIDIVLTSKDIIIVNHSTRYEYKRISKHNFEENLDGCLESLFISIIDYINKDCKVNFIIEKIIHEGNKTTIKHHESK